MSQKKPAWLPEAAFAGPRGWTIKNPDGSEEVLIAARGLVQTVVEVPAPAVETEQTVHSSVGIISVRFGMGEFTEGTKKAVKVSFSDKVVVDGESTIEMKTTEGETIVASYDAEFSGPTILAFSFIVPTKTNVVVTEQELTGTITADGAVVNKTITEELAKKAGSKFLGSFKKQK